MTSGRSETSLRLVTRELGDDQPGHGGSGPSGPGMVSALVACLAVLT